MVGVRREARVAVGHRLERLLRFSRAEILSELTDTVLPHHDT